MVVNLGLAVLLYRRLDAGGLALSNGLAVTVEVLFLLVIAHRRMAGVEAGSMMNTLVRALLTADRNQRYLLSRLSPQQQQRVQTWLEHWTWTDDVLNDPLVREQLRGPGNIRVRRNGDHLRAHDLFCCLHRVLFSTVVQITTGHDMVSVTIVSRLICQGARKREDVCLDKYGSFSLVSE